MLATDLDLVFALEQRAYPFPWTREIFTDCLQAGFPGWVLTDGGGIYGYCMLSYGAGEAHLLNLCIEPDSQGKGLGAIFLDWIIQTASGFPAEVIFLEVRPSNPAAISLYESRGFNQIGLRPGYYRAGGIREDAIVMALQLL